MRSFGFGTHPPTLPWWFVLLGVTRLASCLPIAVTGGIDEIGLEDVNQHDPHVLSHNAPKTPLLAPIPAHIISTPVAAPTTSSRRYTYTPPPTTGVIDTSEPTRPFAFPGFLTKFKSTHTHQDFNANSRNIFTIFRNDDPNTGSRSGFPFKFHYLSRKPPPRSAPITFPSSSSSTSSSSPTLDASLVATTEGSSAVANELFESSQLPLGSWQTNVDPDALAHPSPAAAPPAKLFSVKGVTHFISKNIRLMNPTILGVW